MNYRYYHFDWDGCLGQTLEVWLSSYCDTFKDFGITPSDHEIASQFGDWQGPIKLGLKKDDLESFISKLKERAAERSKTIELYPGALELLEKLKSEGKHIALLTSSVRPIIEMGLRHNDIEKYFEVVITA